MDADRRAGPGAAGAPQGRELNMIMGVLLLAMFLGGLDQTIVSTTLPTVASELHGTAHLSWVVTAYMLATTAFTPLWGKLGDQFGRKHLFLLSIVIFLVGSALCGLAQSMFQLVLFRAFQGVGGAGLTTLSMAIMTALVSPRERGRYQGIFGVNFAASNVLGPLLGGFFVEIGWRWVFYINLPLGVFSLVVIALVLPGGERYRRQQIDYAGMALLSAVTVCFVMIVTWGGTRYPWSSPVIFGLLVAGLAAGVGWYLSARRAAEPVLPLHLFTTRAFVVPSAVAFLLGSIMFCVMIYLPLFMQVVGGYSPLASGLVLLPAVAGALVASVGTGRLVTRQGRYKRYPIVGMALAALGLLQMSRIGRDIGTVELDLALLLLGFGLGMVVQVLITAAQNSVPYRDLGVATSGVTFFRSIGGSFGVAALGSLFSARVERGVEGIARSGQAPAGLDVRATGQDPDLIWALPAPLRARFLEVYSGAVELVMLCLAPIAVLAVLLALLIREVPLRGLVRETLDVGEGGGGAPVVRSSRDELAARLSRLIERDASAREMYARLGALAGVHLPAGSMWALARITVEGPVTFGKLIHPVGMTAEHGRPYVDRLVRAGYVSSTDGLLQVTDAGRAAAERLFAARRAGMERALGDWRPEEHPELAQLLTELSQASLDVPRDLHAAAR